MVLPISGMCVILFVVVVVVVVLLCQGPCHAVGRGADGVRGGGRLETNRKFDLSTLLRLSMISGYRRLIGNEGKRWVNFS
jgi:hypothetical protein